MNDTMIVYSYFQRFQLRAVANFYRSSMVRKIQFFNNLFQLDIAYLRTPEWVTALPITYPIEFLVLHQHAEKQDSSWDKSTPLGLNRKALYLKFGD